MFATQHPNCTYCSSSSESPGRLLRCLDQSLALFMAAVTHPELPGARL